MQHFCRFSLSAVVIAAAVLCGCAGKAETPAPNGDIRITSVKSVLSAIERAKKIRISAWVLSERSDLARALRIAAGHGAAVQVTLDGVPTHNIARTNIKAARNLRDAGIDVVLTTAPLHAKLALIDDVAYLTDRNWTARSRSEIVLRDEDAGDRAIIASGMSGHTSTDERFSTRKGDALRIEADLIRNAPGTAISVETEAFTGGSLIDAALLSRAAGGAKVRLLVDRREYQKNARERTSLVSLMHRGIAVRTGRSGEKMAIVDDRAWVGSANATPGVPNQIDWGMRVPSPLVASVTRSFERNWRAGRPIFDADAAPAPAAGEGAPAAYGAGVRVVPVDE